MFALLHAEVADAALLDCGTPRRDVLANRILLRRADNGWAGYNMPFGFPSFGDTYDKLGVSANGFVKFGRLSIFPDVGGDCRDNAVWYNVNSYCLQDRGNSGLPAAAVCFAGELGWFVYYSLLV